MAQNPGPAQEFIKGEFDRANHRVVAVETTRGQIQHTDQPRVLGAPTEWLPAETRLPEGYLPRLPYLLKQQYKEYGYDPDKNVVTVTYPEADFSREAVREAVADLLKSTAKVQLSQTDWYVTRQAETGLPIPAAVAARRAFIRRRTAELEAEIAQADDETLVNFKVDWDQSDKPAPKDEAPPPGGDGSQWITDATSPDQQGKPVKRADTDHLHPEGPKGPRS